MNRITIGNCNRNNIKREGSRMNNIDQMNIKQKLKMNKIIIIKN